MTEMRGRSGGDTAGTRRSGGGGGGGGGVRGRGDGGWVSGVVRETLS